MKKRSILMLVCALMTTLSIGMSVGCGVVGGLSSVGGNSDLPTASNPTASEETGTSEEQGTSEEPTTSETPGTSETPTTPAVGALTITSPTGEVFPYISNVKKYLQAGAGANVGNYYDPVDSQYAPVSIKWKYDAEGARKFLIEYATKADFSDALSVEAGAAKRSAVVYNLYKATKYYVRVSALNGKGEVIHQAESNFETTALGPRFICVEDVRNMRDLGGYQTASGKTLVQGIAYRGGALTPPPGNVHYTNSITEEGKKYMSEVMGIKTEIDFRTAQESGITLAQGSVIPGATLHYLTLNGYKDTFKDDYHEEYRTLFSMLADVNSYPVYMHCTGGADRTGTVVFLLHALLGVSEWECVQGYELTSFSTYGLRNTQSGTYQDYFEPFITQLKSFDGDTLQDKVETWALSIGVTQQQIDTVRAIFCGEIAIGNQTATVNNVAMPMAEEKPLNEQYAEVLSAWTICKKEN